MAPNGDATDLADAFGVIGSRNRRGVFLEGGELMELQDCASEDEATMGKLRGLCSGMDLEMAFFIDAILENRIVGEGEGIAMEVKFPSDEGGGEGEKEGEEEGD